MCGRAESVLLMRSAQPDFRPDEILEHSPCDRHRIPFLVLCVQYDKSPTGSQTEASTNGGGKSSGLDGIFADLRPSPTRGTQGSAAAPPSSSSGLIIGPPGAKKLGEDRETDRLLGSGVGSLWGRS